MTAPDPPIRIGQGVDVHAFGGPDRPLVLGGVTIPDAPPLAGHSDADVVLHAITDALLGALALGDLGSLVGVDEPQTRGADSSTFLRRAATLVDERGWRVGSIDCTVVAQRPRLASHVPAMREHIALTLSADVGQVSVKATTTDRLGMIGRGEGIACTAVAAVWRP